MGYAKFPEKSFDVIVTYDCSGKDDPFRTELLALLKSKKYTCEEITMSTYKIQRMLDKNEIETLKAEIRNLYNSLLVESKKAKPTVVKIIIPNGDRLIIEEIAF